MWMIISGSKSVKSGQKILKKATNWPYTWFFQKNFALANLIHINSHNMREKSVMSLYSFRTYFFTFGEVQPSFSNLLTTANNYRKILCDFFWANKPLGIVHWLPEMSQKLVILCSETSKFWTKNGHFCTPKILNPFLKLSIHLFISKYLF